VSECKGCLNAHRKTSRATCDACKANDKYIESESDELTRLRDENERLRNRLEFDADNLPDGISCRDETIKGLQGVVDKLRAML